MRISVVGGRGFIGLACVTALRDAGHETTIVSHSRGLAPTAGICYGDLLDEESLVRALAGAEVVIQSATFPTFPVEKPGRRHTFMEFDGLGTERMVAAAQAVGARRFIYVSGCGTGPASTKPYFQAHWRGEQAVMTSGMEPVCLRPALVYGRRDRALNRILRFSRFMPCLPVIGSGRQLHQPVCVDDVAIALSQLVAPGAPTGVFEIGGPERMTLKQLLRRLLKASGRRRLLVHLSKPMMTRLGSLMGRLPGPLLTLDAVEFFCEDFVADLSTLADLKVQLTPLEEGLLRHLR